jgi:3-phenylpropionate/cinnamic acid dioxygenase small subunit
MDHTMLTADDDAQIRNLLARYCLLLDQDDVEAWVALFTPDATYHVYGRTFTGHDGLRQMLARAPGGLHLGGSPAIERVADDHARARQNLLFVDRATGVLRGVLYDDELVRTEDGWRIASRRCRFVVADGHSDRPDR